MHTHEKLGVTGANPEQAVSIEGRSFAETLTHLALHIETLNKVNAVLKQANPCGENEQLAEVQNAVQATANSTTVMLYEHLRWATEQGLRFVLMRRGRSSTETGRGRRVHGSRMPVSAGPSWTCSTRSGTTASFV